VASWRPVIALILSGMIQYADIDLVRNIPQFYPCLVGLLSQDVPSEIRIPLKNILTRIGVLLGVSELPGLPEKSVSVNPDEDTKDEVDVL
jgi:hypothetical protein